MISFTIGFISGVVFTFFLLVVVGRIVSTYGHANPAAIAAAEQEDSRSDGGGGVEG